MPKPFGEEIFVKSLRKTIREKLDLDSRLVAFYTFVIEYHYDVHRFGRNKLILLY